MKAKTVLGVASISFAVLALLACEPSGPPQAPPPAQAPDPVPSAAVASAPSAQASATPAPTPPPGESSAIPADAVKTASGLATKVTTPGTGTIHPGPHDQVTVHYKGWTKDGHVFDESAPGSEPPTFPVDGLIPGWTEGLQLMVAGEKRRMWLPAALAYGDHPKHPDAPAGDLTFDVELLAIKAAPPPPEVPTDVATPPASAKKTASGLAYRALAHAKDAKAAKPTATSLVTVNYSGWTTDGKMFDSSIVRGEPATFPLDRVIPGWTEGLQLMRVGDTFRFWIPGKLAYDAPGRARPGAPQGTLVFDVELLETKEARGAGP